jgi:hypothetical protein
MRKDELAGPAPRGRCREPAARKVEDVDIEWPGTHALFLPAAGPPFHTLEEAKKLTGRNRGPSHQDQIYIAWLAPGTDGLRDIVSRTRDDLDACGRKLATGSHQRLPRGSPQPGDIRSERQVDQINPRCMYVARCVHRFVTGHSDARNAVLGCVHGRLAIGKQSITSSSIAYSTA